MQHTHDLLLLGIIMLLGLGAHTLGGKVHVPRVTLLLLLGALAGPALFDVIPLQATGSFELITELTLAMVGFLLGERMSLRDLREGREAIVLSLTVTLVTALVMFLAVWAFTGNLPAALLLAAIATATDPAATLDVIREAGAKGPLTRVVTQVVAIDDAWGAILFSILLVFAELVAGNGNSISDLVAHGVTDVFGAMILGAAIGWPMAWLTGRLKPGEPMLLEAAGFVFLAAGLAGYLGVSYLLTCMTLGVVVANRAHHHVRPFRSIEGVIDPFFALFFFLAGYSLDWVLLPTLGLLGLVYLLARVAGRLAGGYLGGVFARSEPVVRRYAGACMLPQAGVALGLALVATERLPELTLLLPLVIGATVIFELAGPAITAWQLRLAGEVSRNDQPQL